jgi:hypothetical protein
MELAVFQAQLRDRGGLADVWLVYAIDPFEEVQGGRIVLVLQRGFWTRGEAYAWAQASRQEKRWQQFYVFRASVTLAWSFGTESCAAVFETEFGRPRPLPAVGVSPTELAAVLDD